MSEENAIKEQGQQAEGATTQEQTGSESVTDKHGQQGINLERHKRLIPAVSGSRTTDRVAVRRSHEKQGL